MEIYHLKRDSGRLTDSFMYADDITCTTRVQGCPFFPCWRANTVKHTAMIDVKDIYVFLVFLDVFCYFRLD
jgi:hypothetical protein